MEDDEDGYDVDADFDEHAEAVAEWFESCCLKDAVEFCFGEDAFGEFAGEFGDDEADE